MGKIEKYLEIIDKVAKELRIPLIKENIQHKFKTKKNRALYNIKFKFNEDTSVIKSFFGLADYYHSIVIQDDEKFYIPTEYSLYILEND